MSNSKKHIIDEANDIMRLCANQRVQQINRQLKEKERIEFYKNFFELEQRTSIYSNPHIVENDPGYKAIISMGHKAVPFIYELAVNEDILLIKILEEIYNFKFELPKPKSFSEAKQQSEELKQKWIRKMKDDLGL